MHQGPIPGNSMLAGGRKIMQRNIPSELTIDLKACNNYKNGRKAAAAITCPVQVMIAGKDRMAPAKATATLVEHLPGPEVTYIPESGHMVPQEVPNQCRKLAIPNRWLSASRLVGPVSKHYSPSALGESAAFSLPWLLSSVRLSSEAAVSASSA